MLSVTSSRTSLIFRFLSVCRFIRENIGESGGRGDPGAGNTELKKRKLISGI